jgi:tetratricopeptide (TPR) repeat protein
MTFEKPLGAEEQRGAFAEDRATASNLFSVAQSAMIFLGFFALALVLFFPGISSPMIYDSASFILGDSLTYERGNLQEIVGIVPARPLHMLSIYLNFLITGMEPAYFRLFNLGIQAAAGTALTLLALLVFESFGPPGDTCRDKKAVSILLGLIFVIHPLQTLTVLYIWQREAILACFFFYSGVALYIAVRSGRVSRPYLGYSAVGVFFFLGLTAKENLMTFPAVLVLSEITLFRQSWGATVRRALLIAAVAVPLFLAYALLVHSLHQAESTTPQGMFNRLLEHYRLAGISLLEAILTECRVLFQYLTTIAAPGIVGTPLIKVQTISISLWDPPMTILALAGAAAILSVGIGLVRKSPIVSFGILFFLGTLVPESTLIPQYLYFGYRPILPMAGLLLILGLAALRLLHQTRSVLAPRRFLLVTTGSALIVALYLAALTFSIAWKWNPLNVWTGLFKELPPVSEATEVTPYLDVLCSYAGEVLLAGEKAEAMRVLHEFKSVAIPNGSVEVTSHAESESKPTSERVAALLRRALLRDPPKVSNTLCVLAAAVREAGNLSEAILVHKKAIEIAPGFPTAYEALATTLQKAGDKSGEIEQLRQLVKVDPKHPRGHMKLGMALANADYHVEAARCFVKAARLEPKSAEASYNLAISLLKTGKRPEETLKILAQLRVGSPVASGTALKPGTPELKPGDGSGTGDLDRLIKAKPWEASSVFVAVGRGLYDTGRYAEAIPLHHRGVELDPSSATAYEFLARALEKSGDLDGAIAQFRRLIEISPKSLQGHNQLGLALDKTGKHEEAMKSFLKAVQLAPNSPEANFNVANSLLRFGRAAEAIVYYKKALAAKPDFTDAEANLAAALLASGKFAQATRRLKRAAAAKSDNAELYNLLGVAYAELEKRPDAIEYFNKALAVDPKHEGARQNLERLAK